MTPRERSLQAAQALPDRLKAARKQARLTQDQLVALAEMAPVTLSKLETGVNRPTFEVLVALCYALEVSPNSLVGWGTDDAPVSEADRRQLLSRLNLSAHRLPTEWLERLTEIAEKFPVRE